MRKHKLRRFVKGSREAKRYMSRIRRLKGRKRTYRNGLTKRKRKR